MTYHPERRRGERVRVAAVATLETKGKLNPNDQALCTVRNVSRSGVGLETGQPPMVGQKVHLRVAIDDDVHELRCLATRVDRRDGSNFYDVGLDWSSCTPEQLMFLGQVIQLTEEQPL